MAATQQPAQRRAEQRDGPRPTADLQLEPARRLLCLRTIPQRVSPSPTISAAPMTVPVTGQLVAAVSRELADRQT
jgi:hypothetical protein